MTSSDALDNQVRHYLDSTGWTEQPPGPAGALWHRSRGSDRQVLAVPTHLRPGEPDWRSVIQGIARYEQRSPDEVEGAIRYQFVDAALLRAANDHVIHGSIPLHAGVHLVSSAFTMLRASASTAQQLRPQIAGNFSKIGDDIAMSARMGHTQEGSYIVPILMTLSEPKADKPREPSFEGMERAPYEVAERRVMRTFAEALSSVERLIVGPAREPRAKDVLPLVEAGASRELVRALHKVVADPDVSVFEASFRWATAMKPSGTIPKRVVIPAETAARLDQTAKLMRTSRRELMQIITGPIVEVRHEPDAPFGEIAIQTIRRGRASEVRVQLRKHQLDEAYDWIRTSRPVVVHGHLDRAPGHPLMIHRPRQIHPLDEAYLSADVD